MRTRVILLSIFVFTATVGYKFVDIFVYVSSLTSGGNEATSLASYLKPVGQVQGVITTDQQVKAVEDDITENSLVFRLKVYFLDTIQAVSAVFDADLSVGSNLFIGNDVIVENDLTVNGQLILANATIINDAIIGNNLDVGSDLTIGGTLVSIGEITAPNIIYSITAGDGITVAGTQDITISVSGSELNVSGWIDDGTVVRLNTITDNVGIGTTNPLHKLEVIGTGRITGATTIGGGLIVSGGISNSSGGITNAGPITGTTGFTSSGTITFSDLSTGILHSNINGVISSSALNLAGGASEVTGLLPVVNGGTGLSSVAAGDILYASGANTLTTLGIGAEDDVLIVSGGVPVWGVPGAGAPCATCIVDNPGSTQTIIPTSATATGLIIRQPLGGSVDIFSVSNNDGSTNFFRINSAGEVILGSSTTDAAFSVAPSNTDPISISPVAQGAGSFTGTITSEDLTADRTWTFPDASGIICLASGNCSGTSAAVGGSGTINYVAKWDGVFSITESMIFDDGTNVGIGTTTMGSLLDIAGTFNTDGNATFGANATITGNTDISGTLVADLGVDFNSTLGVVGATTIGSTLDVTGQATIGGNVGISSLTPGYKLDVVGDINFTSALYLNGNAGISGYILTSNAGGANAWTDPSTLTTSGLWANTLNVFHPKDPFAGVVDLAIGGTSTASAKVHLKSDGGAFFAGNVGVGTGIPTGNLGIGTTVFDHKLVVNGHSKFKGSILGLGFYNLGSSNISEQFQRAYLARQLIISNSTTSGSSPMLDLRQTWTSASTTFIGSLINITDTNSAAGSKLLDLQTNSISRISFSKSGDIISQGVMQLSGAGDSYVTGNFGIGSTAPAYKLDIVGELNLTDAIRVVGDAGTSGYFLASTAGGANTWTDPSTLTTSGLWANTLNVFHPKDPYAGVVDLAIGGTSTASANIHLQSNGQAYFAGNVGIGTSTPTADLQIVKSGQATLTTQTSVATSRAVNSVEYADGSIFSYAQLGIHGPSAVGTQFGVSSAGLTYLRATDASSAQLTGMAIGLERSDPLYFATNNLVRMTIAADGNVGIGSLTPGHKLDIVGGINFTGVLSTNGSSGTSGQILVSQGASSPIWQDTGAAISTTAFIQGGNSFGTAAILGTNDAFPLTFETNGSEVARFLTNGNFGIGTTAPIAKLQVLAKNDTGGVVVSQPSVLGSATTLSGSTTTDAYGLTSSIFSGGTISNAYGVYSAITSVTGGTITDGYGLYSAGDQLALGIFTNYAGLYLDTVASATNKSMIVINASGAIPSGNYGIYNASTANNYFAGNIGIGTNSPVAELEVVSTLSTSPRGIISTNYIDNTGGPNIIFHKARGGLGTPAAVQSGDVLGNLQFAGYDGTDFSSTVGISAQIRAFADETWSNTAHGNYMVFETVANTTITRSEQMRIANDGNVGIGTTNTNSQKLTVNGHISLQASGIETAQIRSNTSILDIDQMATGTSASSVRFFRLTNTTGAKQVQFLRGDGGTTTDALIGVDGANSYFQMGGGNLGIGASGPAQKLHVQGTARITGSVAVVDDRTLCTLSSSGDIELKNGACGTSSLKYKENIADLSYGLDAIKALRPVFFNYKNYDPQNEKDRTKKRLGFIAEEMNLIVPEVVIWDNGEIDGIDYAYLTAVLTKGIQQQQVQISTISKTINQLSSKIQDLVVASTAIIKDLHVESFSINGQSLANYIISIVNNQGESSNNELFFPSDKNTVNTSATQSGQIAFNNAEIVDTQAVLSELITTIKENVLFTQEASTFIRNVVFGARTQFMASVEFIQTTVFKGEVAFSKESAGTVVVPAYSKAVKVSFDRTFTQEPNVYITNRGEFSTEVIVSEITKEFFVLRFKQPTTSDISIQWLAILAQQTNQVRVEVLESQLDKTISGIEIDLNISNQENNIQDQEFIESEVQEISGETPENLESSESAVLGATESSVSGELSESTDSAKTQ